MTANPGFDSDTSKDLSGRDLEVLTEQIFRELKGSQAVIEHNVRVPGSLSGTDRQIDVSIRWQDPLKESRLAVVEARDWKSPLDVTHIDGLVGKLRDVGADRGILVGANGFTASALTYARSVGIDLYAPHDSASGRWTDIFKLPVVWTTLTPVLLPQLNHEANSGDTIHGDSQTKFFTHLSDDGGKTRIRLLKRFADLWNSGQLSREPGKIYSLRSKKPVTIRVIDREGRTQWRPANDFVVRYTVHCRHWLGRVNPSESRGLVDLLDRRIVVSHMDIPLVRDRSWTEIDDPEAVPVRLRGHIYTLEDAVMDPDVHKLGSVEIRNLTTGGLEYQEPKA